MNKLQQIVCQKIVSGGQTGVDRGALDACLKLSFPCGGWCPKNRIAEDGKIDLKYPLDEAKSTHYSFRTEMNVRDSDGTLIISPDNSSAGTKLTEQIAKRMMKPLLLINPYQKSHEISGKYEFTAEILFWLNRNKIKILNIAGPRKSEWETGYQISFQIACSIINEIKKQQNTLLNQLNLKK